MRGPLDLSRELLQAEVLHEIVHLPRRIDDVAELPEVLGVPRTACVGVRLFDADTHLVAAFVPAGTSPSAAAVAGAGWSRWVRPLTDPARVCALTESHPYLVSPIGLPRDTWLVADESLTVPEVLFTPTGDGSTALKIRSDDLLALTGAAVASLVDPDRVAEPRAAEPAWRDDRIPVQPLRA